MGARELTNEAWAGAAGKAGRTHAPAPSPGARQPGLAGPLLAETMPLEQLFARADELRAAGRIDDAIGLYFSWVDRSQHPHRHLALFNLGSLLQSEGDLPGAIATYQACLNACPGFGQAVINLGLAQERVGHVDLALQTWGTLAAQRYLNEGTDSALLTMALNHIGRVHENHKRYLLAERALEASLLLDPKQPAAIQHWVHVRQKACLWPVYKPLPGLSANEQLMATSPLAMLALDDDPAQQLLTAHAFVGRTYPLTEECLSKGRHYRHSRVRIGYVSGDLCVHAVGLLLAEFLEQHDRERFEIYGYDFSPEDGTAQRMRLVRGFDHLRPIHQLADRDVAQLVLEDEIDVLIDLHGLSSGARPGIFALHPAPLQGTWLGFIGTTAMPWFDFVIADRHVLPESGALHFRERALHVDGSFLPVALAGTPARQATRAEFGLREDAWVMAAFGNSYKLNPTLFSHWMNILRRAPNAVLWLIDDNATARENLVEQARRAGADLSRIHFSPRTSHAEYRAYLSVADLFLDTYPYNCGSTTNDVLQAGLPVLTVSGRTMVSRMGGSLLQALNLGGMVARDLAQYEDMAVAFATGERAPEKIKLDPALSRAMNLKLARSIERGLLSLMQNPSSR